MITCCMFLIFINLVNALLLSAILANMWECVLFFRAAYFLQSLCQGYVFLKLLPVYDTLHSSFKSE